MPEPLSSEFFRRPTVPVAQDLLGARLVHEHPSGGRLEGRIVETEAYTENDPACHASHLSRDPDSGEVSGQGRARDLFAAPGTAYVYLIYGVHWLLNVVTEPEGTAGAVLLRAVEPENGLEFMYERRGVQRRRALTNGPGKLTEAFGVGDAFHQSDLTDPPLYIAGGSLGPDQHVERSSRIGISKGVDRQWRFYVRGHPFVSPGVPSSET